MIQHKLQRLAGIDLVINWYFVEYGKLSNVDWEIVLGYTFHGLDFKH